MNEILSMKGLTVEDFLQIDSQILFLMIASIRIQQDFFLSGVAVVYNTCI